MKNKVLILVCFLIVLSGIGIVSAEILTGTLTGSGYNSTSYTITYTILSGEYYINGFYVNDIQYTWGTKSLIRFDNGHKPVFNDSVSGRAVPFIGTWDNYTVCTGTIGYQRLWDSAWPIPNEIDGYQYLVFDTWDSANYTGDLFITLNYDRLELGLHHLTYRTLSTALPSGKLAFGVSSVNSIYDGNYLLNKDFTFLNTYTATKPAGLGIVGVVTKTIENETYGSMAWVFNWTDNTPLASQSTVTTDNLLFNVPATTIKICVQDSLMNWHNSSQLFTDGFPTPTPTVTPTATPTPVPTVAPGYVRSTLHVWDRAANHVHGANIQIRDNEAAVWANSTADADGIYYIDTLPYHTLNAYADFDIFANELLPGEVLGVDVGYYGTNFYITLYPYESIATPGNVSFYVEVKDADTGYYLTYAIVDMTISSNGMTYSQNTANTGSAVFLVPNDTMVYATARKAGYISQTQFANSGDDTTEVMVIELSRATVTTAPTSTVPPGGVTPVITVDPAGAPDSEGNYPSGYSTVKGQQMMDWLAANGMGLVQLCFLITVLALLGIKFGK